MWCRKVADFENRRKVLQGFRQQTKGWICHLASRHNLGIAVAHRKCRVFVYLRVTSHFWGEGNQHLGSCCRVPFPQVSAPEKWCTPYQRNSVSPVPSSETWIPTTPLPTNQQGEGRTLKFQKKPSQLKNNQSTHSLLDQLVQNG